jgi:hypothetical protein
MIVYYIAFAKCQCPTFSARQAFDTWAKAQFPVVFDQVTNRIKQQTINQLFICTGGTNRFCTSGLEYANS